MKLEKQIEKLKEAYSERDELVDELLDAGITHHQFGKIMFVMVDNFENKNAVFRTTSVRRFEAKFARTK